MPLQIIELEINRNKYEKDPSTFCQCFDKMFIFALEENNRLWGFPFKRKELPRIKAIRQC
jgi:hypothetical protein